MTMKKTLSIMAAAAVLSCAAISEAREPTKAAGKDAKAQELIDKAWAAQDQEMGLKEIDESIKYLEEAIKIEPDNVEIIIELADEYYQRGDQMPRNSDADYEARKKYFEKGLELAEKALAMKESAAAHYWVAVNLAATRENDGKLSQAAIFPSLNEHMTRVAELDKHYKYGGSARFWARVTTRVPGVVLKMLDQDPAFIFEELEMAIKTEPRFLDNYVYKAEFYNNQDKKEEALAALDEALKMDPEALPEERAYNRYAQKKAKEYWKEWTGKDYPDK